MRLRAIRRLASPAGEDGFVASVVNPYVHHYTFTRLENALLARYTKPYAVTAIDEDRAALFHPLEVRAVEFGRARVQLEFLLLLRQSDALFPRSGGAGRSEAQH
jgi:hypothetical protein